MNDEPKPIPRRLRFEVLRRDNYTCRYCGAQAPDAPLTVDHVIPRALGGANDPTNLVTACDDCNNGKASTSPDEHIVADVEEKALEWAAAIEKAAEHRRGELSVLDDQLGQFYDTWTNIFTSDRYMADGWEGTISGFLTRGLSLEDLKRFVYVAAGSQASLSAAFRYFCGCCWRELGDREEIARRIIEDGGG